MTIELSKRRVAAARIAAITRRLLDASTLCAIATVAPGGRAHVNTAYFAWSPSFELVWLSEPRARHSRNIRANPSVAIAVYDSDQAWGNEDRGLQLFGTAQEIERAASADADRVYGARFREFERTAMLAYRFYVFRARRLKIFDERELGSGIFVTAVLARDRRPVWERTEIYRP